MENKIFIHLNPINFEILIEIFIHLFELFEWEELVVSTLKKDQIEPIYIYIPCNLLMNGTAHTLNPLFLNFIFV